MSTIVHYPWTGAFAALLGWHGQRSGSLSTSGSIAACLLGYLTLANPLKVFGVALLMFYLSGSRATKYKARLKASLEDDHHAAGPTTTTTTKPGGNRSATQVACNAWLGTACAVVWRFMYSGDMSRDNAWSTTGTNRCSLDPKFGSSRTLVLGAVAFWSACAGDTLGMLSNSPPVLITTLKPCPRGTNGGVSVWGLVVSLAGGVLVSSMAAFTLSLENVECHSYVEGQYKLPFWAVVVSVGAWSGVVGSLLDSVLGATLQQSLYSSSRRKIVHSRVKRDEQDVIANVPGSGYNVLSNNAVNFVSASLTTLAVMSWASRP
ncbi:hypothetical protein OIO90_002520 [Microbotryomycetes sp. JL221]|nr:hypothetical protein OIO90_002520 [Microbotryomycetes sp. JL221]